MKLNEAKHILKENGYKLVEVNMADDDLFDELTEIVYNFFKSIGVKWNSSWKRDTFKPSYKGIYDFYTELDGFGKIKLKIFNDEVTAITIDNKSYTPREFVKLIK